MNHERAALLKCRAAGRMDSLADAVSGEKGEWDEPTPEEAAEEQAARCMTVADHTFKSLEAAGKLYRPKPGQLRLTDAGRAMLGAPADATLYIVGNEGALKVTALTPVRSWMTYHRLGESKKMIEERVMLGSASFQAKGRVLHDGGYTDRISGKREMFYCRIMPEESRAELLAIDTAIEEAERAASRLRRERQELLASAARRGAKVPMPPRTEEKPA